MMRRVFADVGLKSFGGRPVHPNDHVVSVDQLSVPRTEQVAGGTNNCAAPPSMGSLKNWEIRRNPPQHPLGGFPVDALEVIVRHTEGPPIEHLL
jgi:hypothetical protein